MKDLYGDVAPEDLPVYPISDVARYLQIPGNTVRAWVRGTTYSRNGRSIRFKPVIHPAHPSYLSLRNFFELLILKTITRGENIPLQRVRIAVEVLQAKFGTEHPLSDIRLLTDKTDILVEEAGGILNVSRSGQQEMVEMIRKIVRRIEISGDGHIIFKPYDDGIMDPSIQFGRLCIAGTRIPTEDVFLRHEAGESIIGISKDLSCTPTRIEKAIKYEQSVRKAA